MNSQALLKTCIASIVLLTAASCAYPISKHLRERAEQENIAFPAVLAAPDAYRGRTVLWGGKIIEAINRAGGTDIIILETPLDYWEVPGAAESSRGRFIARSPKFLDPAIYTANRDITMAGQVIGAEEKTLGATTYTYPVVMAEEIYLWERYNYPYSDHYWYDPFWGPSYYFYGSPSFYYDHHEHGHEHGHHGGHHR